MRIVWTVVNDSFKTVATFEFSQKEAAETKAKELTERGKGTHFVQRVKEPMPEDAPGLGAAIPRTAHAPAPAPAREPEEVATLEEEEEHEEDEEAEADLGDEDEEE